MIKVTKGQQLKLFKKCLLKMIVVFSSVYYSNDACSQKTFYKELNILSNSNSSDQKATVLEKGYLSYFTLSNGSFKRYDPIAITENDFQIQGPYLTYLNRFDLDGVNVRKRTLSTKDMLWDMCYSKQTDTENEYLYILQGGNKIDNVTGSNPIVMKIIANNDSTFGNEIWSKRYFVKWDTSINTGNRMFPQSIAPFHSNFNSESDEGCVISSYLVDFNLVGNFQGTFGDFLMVSRIDQNGDEVWKNFIQIDPEGLSRVRMVQNENGVYVLCSYNKYYTNYNIVLKLDNSNGSISESRELHSYSFADGLLYDITSDGENIVLCGKVKSFNSDFDGVVVRLNKDLSISNLNSITVVNNKNNEVFFRVTHDKGNEYSIGGYFLEKDSTDLSISSLKIYDNDSNLSIGYHNYLDQSKYGELILVDMENDLSCGSIFLLNCTNSSNFSLDKINVLLRTYQNNFGCQNHTLNDTTNSVFFIDSISFNEFTGSFRIFSEKTTYLDTTETMYITNCEKCQSKDTIAFNTIIAGKGTVTNACGGDTLIAPTCYAYYEWFLNGNLYKKTKEHTLLADTHGAFSIKAHYSETCFDRSNVVYVRQIPKPDFSFNDNCIGALASIFTNTTPISPNIANTTWDFGDGSTDNSMNNSAHTYLSPGAFDITLTKVSDHGCVASKTKSINIYSLPDIDFEEQTFLSGKNPQFAICQKNAGSFVGTATANLGQSMSNWEWDFNDSNQVGYAIGQTNTFQFSNLGTHNISLIVTTDKGCRNYTTKSFDVYLPSGNFNHDKVCDGDDVTFTGNYSTPYGSISNFDWKINSIPVGSMNPLTINSMSKGLHTTSIKVSDSYGCWVEQNKNIEIFSNPIVSFTNTISCSGSNMNFTGIGSSNGSSIKTWSWNFGDGGTSSNQSPAHNYSNGGTYNPSLSIVDQRGCKNSHSHAVSVLSSPAIPLIVASPSTHHMCANSSLVLNASNVAPGNQLKWSANSYAPINSATGYSVTYNSGSNSSSEIIGLKVIDPMTGCFTFATPYGINVHALDLNINSNNPNNVLCPNSSIQLSGVASVPQQHYQWQYSSNSGMTWVNVGTDDNVYSANISGWYRYQASNSFGCSDYSSVVIINNAGSLNISDNLTPNGQLAPALSPFAMTINTNNAPKYSDIQWYRNDIPIPNANSTAIHFSLPGDYYVTATGCGIEKSNINVVNYDVVSGSWDNTYIAGYNCYGCKTNLSSPPGRGYIMNGDIVLNGGADLTIEAIINFQGDRRIIVNSGCKLTITNQSVISGETQWEGIFVASGGTLIINQSDISNAVVGVMSQNGGRINIQNSTFGRNVVHVVIDDYNLVVPAYLGSNEFGHVIDAGMGLICNNYNEYNNLNIPRGRQIYVKGSPSANAVTFEKNKAWLTQQYSGNDNVFVFAEDNPKITLLFNQIKGFYTQAVHLENCMDAEITGNFIHSLKNLQYGYACPCWQKGTGIYLKNTEQALVSTNELHFWENGLEYYENLSSSVVTEVSDNKFLDNKFGLVVAPIAYPIGSANAQANKREWSNQIELSFTCNLFDANEVGVIGSGLLREQGTSSLSAGNRFKNINVLNIYHSILWNCSSSWNYNNSLKDDFPTAANPISIEIDGNIINSNNQYYDPNKYGNTNNCTSNLNRILEEDENTSVEPDQINQTISVYPNPVLNMLQIVGLQGTATVSIYSSSGQHLQSSTTDAKQLQLDLSAYSNGMYLIHIQVEKGTSIFKIIKSSEN
jgi:PKD repeat protein